MSQGFVKVDIERHHGHGSTDPGALLPRERFSYWCFDLLFLICSDVTKGASIVISFVGWCIYIPCRSRGFSQEIGGTELTGVIEQMQNNAGWVCC